MIKKIEKQLLDFLGMALWEVSYPWEPLSPEEWMRVYVCAEKQGVIALMLKGAEPYKAQMPPEISRKLRGYLVSAVIRNDHLMAVQDELVNLMAAHQISCAILKGSSLSKNYPLPEVRPLGDIDMLIHPRDAERTKKLLCEQGFHPEDTGHPFHLDFYGNDAVIEMHFYGNDVVIEMHWQVSNFPDSTGGDRAKEMMQSALESVDIIHWEGHRFPMLKPLHQALSLLLHMERHMTMTGIGLRQLCDWAAFVNSVDAAIFEKQVLPALEQCGLLYFAQVLTQTCVAWLSMPAEKAQWCRKIPQDMCSALMTDIFREGNQGKNNKKASASYMFLEQDGTEKRRNAIAVVLRKLTRRAKKFFPITQRFPILLPVFWLYYPLKYLIRERKTVSIPATFAAVKNRRELYDDLYLFVTKKKE